MSDCPQFLAILKSNLDLNDSRIEQLQDWFGSLLAPGIYQGTVLSVDSCGVAIGIVAKVA